MMGPGHDRALIDHKRIGECYKRIGECYAKHTEASTVLSFHCP